MVEKRAEKRAEKKVEKKWKVTRKKEAMTKPTNWRKQDPAAPSLPAMLAHRVLGPVDAPRRRRIWNGAGELG
jgi:hypothetical protein